jgi:general secretion pathway protein I
MNPSHRRRRTASGHPAASGFTLVEVLVALTIVALALGAGMRAAGNLTRNTGRLADVTHAQWCAENALTDLRLARQFPGVGEAEFNCEQRGRQYRGQLITQTTQNPNFRLVTAAVLDDDGQRIVQVHTVLGRY